MDKGSSPKAKIKETNIIATLMITKDGKLVLPKNGDGHYILLYDKREDYFEILNDI